MDFDEGDFGEKGLGGEKVLKVQFFVTEHGAEEEKGLLRCLKYGRKSVEQQQRGSFCRGGGMQGGSSFMPGVRREILEVAMSTSCLRSGGLRRRKKRKFGRVF